MSKRNFYLLVLIGIPVALWAAFGLVYPSFSWTQKTAITVSTPSGEATGSGAVQVSWRDGPNLFKGSAPHFSYSYKGEASVVDLGNGKYLFALITDAELQALQVFGERPLPQFTNALIASAKMTEDKMGAGAVSVPVEFMPLLVTFDDITKPETVKRVDPNNLAASFGAGYGLKSITLEITGEPVTEGKVESLLGCLSSGKACIPLNRSLEYGHPMRNILNSVFVRN